MSALWLTKNQVIYCIANVRCEYLSHFSQDWHDEILLQQRRKYSQTRIDLVLTKPSVALPNVVFMSSARMAVVCDVLFGEVHANVIKLYAGRDLTDHFNRYVFAVFNLHITAR